VAVVGVDIVGEGRERVESLKRKDGSLDRDGEQGEEGEEEGKWRWRNVSR
jgi:hypothetical protein